MHFVPAGETMKVALPILDGRIAPVFDWCRWIALVDTDEEGVENRAETDLAGIPPLLRADRLAELGADVLLCGGISPGLAQLVESHGIQVMPWVAGEVDEVLREFLAGRLPNERFMMPGSRCGGRGGRHRRGRRW